MWTQLDAPHDAPHDAPRDAVDLNAPLPSVNGIALRRADESITVEELRQRACTEMLRQEAQRQGLLAAEDAPGADGNTSAAASHAIEALLEHALRLPETDPEDCRRYYDAHAATFRTGERAHVRHILFALTPGMDLAALRARAETCLLDVRCHDGRGADKFAPSAQHLSNCPSAAHGGDLGWLTRDDCAPEFAQAIFGERSSGGLGVLAQLVHTRFGLHVVEVLAREAGEQLPYDAVASAVKAMLHQRVYVAAIRQYLTLLAAGCELRGVDLETTQSPLLR